MIRPNTPRRRHHQGSPSGFTLVELLATILILALLIGLLLPAINGAMKAGRRATVTSEISQLAQALESFKTKYGDYPPSRIYLSENGYFPIAVNPATSKYVSATMAPYDATVVDIRMYQLAQRSVAVLRRMFPKVLISTDPTNPVFGSGSTTWYDFNGNGTFDGHYILQGHECLAFFLGGIPLKTDTGYAMTGFGTNPSNPFTNSINIAGSTMYGANRNTPFYEFAPGRLVIDPINPTSPGIPGYYDSLGNTPPNPTDPASALSQLNFIAYFSTTGVGGGYDPNDVNFSGTEGDGHLNFIFQGGTVLSPAPNPYTSGTTNPTTGTISYQKAQSFQLISAGLDGLYGIGGQYSPPPAPTALPADMANTTLTPSQHNPNVDPATAGTIRVREKDNITNFGAASQLD